MLSEKLPFKTVCIFPDTIYRELIIDFFIHLKRRIDFDIVLIASKKEETAYYEDKYGDIIAKCYTNRDFLLALLKDCSQTDRVFLRAKDIEERYNTRLMHHVIANRHMGRGFALGAPYFPRSIFSRKANYWNIMDAIVNQYAFLEGVFSEKNVDLVVGGDKIAADVCRKNGIAHRYLAPYKYKTYAYWAMNEYWESNVFERAFRETRKGDRIEEDSFSGYYKPLLDKTRKEGTLWHTLRTMSHLTARRIYWQLKAYEKVKGYFLSEELAYALRSWWRIKLVKQSIQVSAESLTRKDYLFYPLHLEPERAMNTFSPEFFDQIFAVVSLSKELPAGKFLVVKEHIGAIPVRPKCYYDQLREMQNVLLADPFESGLEYMKRAKAVVSITGTAGFEAAVMGVPVITFGQHNLYNVLDHVHVVKGWTEIAPLMPVIFGDSDADDLEREKRVRAGGIFIEAFKRISVDIEERRDRTRDEIFGELESRLMGTYEPEQDNAIKAAAEG